MSFLCTSYVHSVVFFRLDTVRDHHFSGLASPASEGFSEQRFFSCSESLLGFSAVIVKSNGQNEQEGEWTGGGKAACAYISVCNKYLLSTYCIQR